jgi:hypothetical protein
MSETYQLYAEALHELEAAEVRAVAAGRAAHAEQHAEQDKVGRAIAEARARVAALSDAREQLARDVAALPVTAPEVSARPLPATSDPLGLADQLVSRARAALAGCAEDVAAIERQRKRIDEARHAADVVRRRTEAERAANAQATEREAAHGDRLLLQVSLAAALCAAVLGVVGPTGIAVVAAVGFGVIFGQVACRRLSHVPSRVAGSRSFPPRGAHAAVMYALGCGAGGLGTFVGGLIGADIFDVLFGLALVAGAAVTFFVLTNTRGSAGGPTT